MSDFVDDVVAGSSVTFGFDPSTIGGGAVRILSVSLLADSSVTVDYPVSVASAAASIRLNAPASATQGDTITVSVDALDAGGAELGDATGVSVITSSVASDVIVGDEVLFVDASPHVLTATIPGADGFSSSATVEVAAAAGLGVTGAEPGAAIMIAVSLLALGTGFAVAARAAGARKSSRVTRCDEQRVL